VSRRPRRGTQRGQATVELALVLPVVVVVLLVLLQVGMALRDRIQVQHATRTAARAVIVEPTQAAAAAALRRAGVGRDARVALGGDTRPGGLATVTVTMPATVVPLVGRLVADHTVRDSLTVMVE
jgi:Flp pilus assembly protein TadG